MHPAHALFQVSLVLYDLLPSVTQWNDIAGTVAPALHVGLLVHGIEWSFSECGIYRCRSPGQVGHHVFRSVATQPTWQTTYTDGGVLLLLKGLYGRFQTYDLVHLNCVDFCEAFLYELTGQPIPPQIKILSTAGKLMTNAFRSIGYEIDILTVFRTLFPGSSSGSSSTSGRSPMSADSDVIVLSPPRRLEMTVAPTVPPAMVHRLAQTPPPKWTVASGTPLPPQPSTAPPVLNSMPVVRSAHGTAYIATSPVPAATPVKVPASWSGGLATSPPASQMATPASGGRSAGVLTSPSFSPQMQASTRRTLFFDESQAPARDRSRSVNVMGTVEIPPHAGQLPADWLKQEFSRGRQMARAGDAGRHRQAGPDVITWGRVAQLFFSGSTHRARDWFARAFPNSV